MNKVEREKQTVTLMVTIYCKAHHSPRELCADCAGLLDYAHARLDYCPEGSAKKACKHCPKHCYNKPMGERIRQVMRFAGPRMIFRAPITAIRHLLSK